MSQTPARPRVSTPTNDRPQPEQYRKWAAKTPGGPSVQETRPKFNGHVFRRARLDELDGDPQG